MPDELPDELPDERAREKARIQVLIRQVFDSPAGKEVLHEFIRLTLLNPSIDVSNPYMSYVNEGQRRFVLSILRQVYKDDAEVSAAIVSTYET
jgi:hypothetical protein